MDPLCSSYGVCTYMGRLAQVIISVDENNCFARFTGNVSKVKVVCICVIYFLHASGAAGWIVQ